MQKKRRKKSKEGINIIYLTCMDTLPYFSTILSKGNNLRDFLFALMTSCLLPWTKKFCKKTFYRKNLHLEEQILFLFKS